MAVTHIRKMNYISWIQDIFRLSMIFGLLIVIDTLAMTTVISDDANTRIFLLVSQSGYIIFYISKIVMKNDPTYWTYIEVDEVE